MAEEKTTGPGKKEPHVLTEHNIARAEEGMKAFLNLYFEAADRGDIYLTKKELGPDVTQGIISPEKSWANRVSLYDIAFGMGIPHERIKGLSDHHLWQELFQGKGHPRPGDSDAGWSHGDSSPGNVG